MPIEFYLILFIGICGIFCFYSIYKLMLIKHKLEEDIYKDRIGNLYF